ncbi:MAG: hypothetical protein AAGL49_09065, partial [Pseudomonadota bacterium]
MTPYRPVAAKLSAAFGRLKPLALALLAAACVAPAARTPTPWEGGGLFSHYEGGPEIVRGAADGSAVARGVVFE